MSSEGRCRLLNVRSSSEIPGICRRTYTLGKSLYVVRAVKESGGVVRIVVETGHDSQGVILFCLAEEMIPGIRSPEAAMPSAKSSPLPRKLFPTYELRCRHMRMSKHRRRIPLRICTGISPKYMSCFPYIV